MEHGQAERRFGEECQPAVSSEQLGRGGLRVLGSAAICLAVRHAVQLGLTTRSALDAYVGSATHRTARQGRGRSAGGRGGNERSQKGLEGKHEGQPTLHCKRAGREQPAHADGCRLKHKTTLPAHHAKQQVETLPATLLPPSPSYPHATCPKHRRALITPNSRLNTHHSEQQVEHSGLLGSELG